ncbi:MAG: 30S ribosomal protein S18 [Clostridia bacterium]|jgi:small subunit ribosomal protein S18|nr:30S ribosomal protein S18 [Clostridia bacterium]
MAERTERPERPRNGRKGRRKVCRFCADKIETIDYKDVARLRNFVSERAKILPRRVTGTCARHQRELTVAIKRARQIALMPFISD